jgi:dienelactone hydrolase
MKRKQAKLDPLEDFRTLRKTYDGKAFEIYTAGKGPGILVMHEIPGITPTVADCARRLVAAGFRVWMPHMFGEDGKKLNPLYGFEQIGKACIRREFTVLATGKSSPIVQVLRKMCRDLSLETVEYGGKVGAIGMCISGNFALALAVEDVVQAPVLSQPSLPFAITAAQKKDVHASAEEIAAVQQRCASENLEIMALRFTHDFMVPDERIETLKSCFPDNLRLHEIDSSLGNPNGVPLWAHSVVAHDFVDREGHPTREVWDQVVAFYREKLTEPANQKSSATT